MDGLAFMGSAPVEEQWVEFGRQGEEMEVCTHLTQVVGPLVIE